MALILVVEDEALLRWSLVRRLEGVGHRVLQAGSAAEARAALADGAPDLLILDLSLPDGDGLDFLEACRDLLGPAVVMVTTAVGEASDAARAALLEVSEFLTKPVPHDELVRLVDRHCHPAHPR